jgi:hypothetical protein
MRFLQSVIRKEQTYSIAVYVLSMTCTSYFAKRQSANMYDMSTHFYFVFVKKT